MDALKAILTRRSTRLMKPVLPPRECIEQIVEAGRYAPSGSNSQLTRFIIITDPAVLQMLAELVQTAFASMEADEHTYVSLRNSITAAKRGGYRFHYDAPVLIVTANRKEYGNAMADSACALENMMIAANALDIGSCWINQLHWLSEVPAVRACMETLGMTKDEFVTGGLILGYPIDAMPDRTPLKRTGNPVVWIEPNTRRQ